MVDVFISYSRSNQEVVRQLADAVKRLRYDVWWDDELPPHLSYGDVITEKIAEAKAAIVVWSRSSTGSEWVRAEADLARNRKKLIQTSIDDCTPPMPFNQIQFASLATWNGEDDHPGWTKVKGSLAALCGEGADVMPAYALPDAPPPAATSTSPVAQPVAFASTPPKPMSSRPQSGRSNLLIGAMIGGALALIAGIGVLALTRGSSPAGNQAGAPPTGNAVHLAFPASGPPPSPAPRPVAAAPRPAATAPRPTPVVPSTTPARREAAARQPQKTQIAAGQNQRASMPARQRRAQAMQAMPPRMAMRRGRQLH